MNDSARHSRTRWLETRPVLAGALALGWMSACTGLGSDVPIEDLGDTNGGLTDADPVPQKLYLEQVDPGFAGHWVGYVENPFERDEAGQPVPAAFASGSSEVTLDFRLGGEFSDPSATLVFGAGPPPTPERGVAYPPGVHHYYTWVADVPRGPFRAPVVEGFEYALGELGPRFAGFDPGQGSLLGFAGLAPFVDWCALQKPPGNTDDNFECLGAGDAFSGGDPIPGGDSCIVTRPDRSEERVDCDFAAMCMSDLCSCDANGCGFAGSEEFATVFLERDGDEIVGTLSNATLDSGYPSWYIPMGTLRLFRAD